jgi:hypothetical protein
MACWLLHAVLQQSQWQTRLLVWLEVSLPLTTAGPHVCHTVCIGMCLTHNSTSNKPPARVPCCAASSAHLRVALLPSAGAVLVVPSREE